MYVILYFAKIVDYQTYYKASREYIGNGILLGLSIIILTVHPKLLSKNRRVIILLFCFLFLIMIGARGPLIFTLLTLMFWVVISRIKFTGTIHRYISLKKIVIISLGLCIVLFSVIYFDNILLLAFKRYSELFLSIVKGTYSGGYNIRIEYLKFVWNHFDDTFLFAFFGHGCGSFGYYFTGEDVVLYPHNIIMEIIFEFGLLGLTIFVLFLISSIKKIRIDNLLTYTVFFIFLNALKSFNLSDIRIFFRFLSLVIYSKYVASESLLI